MCLLHQAITVRRCFVANLVDMLAVEITNIQTGVWERRDGCWQSRVKGCWGHPKKIQIGSFNITKHLGRCVLFRASCKLAP